MKQQVKNYRLEWLDDSGKFLLLSIVETADIIGRLADLAAKMIITAPTLFPADSLKYDRIIDNIRRSENFARIGKEFYFICIGEQVLTATEIKI